MYVLDPALGRGAERGSQRAGAITSLSLVLLTFFGTRTAMMVAVFPVRHLAMWVGYILEAGRPKGSEAMPRVSGRERRALRGPNPLQWVPLALTYRYEDTLSHLPVSPLVRALVTGTQPLFPYLTGPRVWRIWTALACWLCQLDKGAGGSRRHCAGTQRLLGAQRR